MNNSDLHEIAQALDPLLPAWSLNWDPVNRPRYALFTNTEGAGLYIELNRSKTPNRLVATGRYPIYPRPENRVRITISSARPIADIATDIQRRFIPRYLEVYSQVRERQRLAEETERQEAAILAELAAILDERVSDDRVIRYSSNRDGHFMYGSIEVAKNLVKVNLSGLPATTAREICRLLGEIG